MLYYPYMLGYVTPEQGELKVRELEWYRAYYCGVCKSIRARYGQLPRLALSYDAAFLALLLAGVADEAPHLHRERCLTHPIRKKLVAANGAIDYSADIMLLLARHKLEDDVFDEGSWKARMLQHVATPWYRKARCRQPEMDLAIRRGLLELMIVEASHSPHLDEAGDVFGRIMGTVTSGYAPVHPSARILERAGYHLGRWIYLMDAWEDIEENQRTGAYNPLLYRDPMRKGESQEDFRKRIYHSVECALLLYLSELGKAIDLLELHQNQTIIENIIYMGLLRRTDQALGKEQGTHGKPL